MSQTDIAQVKVSELEGGLLDYWVSRALGKNGVDQRDPLTWPSYFDADYGCAKAVSIKPDGTAMSWAIFSPSSDWARGGELIESQRVKLVPPAPEEDGLSDWRARVWNCRHFSYGPTPLIAACRAIVGATLGDTLPAQREE